ncbi:MAG: NUDIX hydrolase [Proteobacteria bacterium]|nr:NUDIX hydrolase [Pseudomonadota bacterium]
MTHVPSQTWEEDGDPWRITASSVPFRNAWFHIDKNDVIHPDGSQGEYTVVRFWRTAVGVLPIEADGSVHLVGQWRFPLGRYSWEMPEGGGEPGETPLVCARRELEEETGLRASTWAPILEMDLSNSVTDERGVIFLATGLESGEKRPEATEVLRHRRVPFAELLARVLDGRIRDSLTVAAALRAHHMAITGELPESLAAAMLGKGTGS